MNKRQAYDDIDALNYSKAKRLLRSPRHFLGELDKSTEKSTSLLLGYAVHALLLEGLNISKVLSVKPEGMKFTTSDGKAWRAAQSKPIVTYDEMTDISGMVNAILDNDHARNILSTCLLREQIFTNLIQDVACKALIDGLGKAEGQPAVVEIKTSLDCRSEFFSKRAVSDPYHYDMQAVWYRTLAKAAYSCWIVVENKQPWDVAVYFPGEGMRESGRLKMDKALKIYKMCRQLDRWPGSQPDPQILDLPRWYSVENVLALTLDENRLLTDNSGNEAKISAPAEISS